MNINNGKKEWLIARPYFIQVICETYGTLDEMYGKQGYYFRK